MGAVMLTPLDLIIIGVPLAVVLAVSVVMRRYLRSVADFLAASRCAGRYLICTASQAVGPWGLGFVAYMEVFSKTGFSLSFWSNFTSFIVFVLTLSGFVSYRFRQTRAMTFHQFFEVRYSRGVRVFASFLNVFSGLFNFGLVPGVVSKFFVYFLALPEHLTLGFVTLPTYVVLMVVFIGISLFMTLSGGQISVMITDCLEGLISGVFYLVVSVAILLLVSHQQVATVMLSGPPGKSFINPLDISGQPDFNIWFVVIGMLAALYFFRGNAWNQGFAAAAASPHENRMAGVLGMWRMFASAVMGGLVGVGALVVLNHPDFAAQAARVEESLRHIDNPQLRTQLRMPVALGLLLPPGVKGAFCAIAFFGVLAGMGSAMHSFGSTFIQDVLLPFRKQQLAPKQHIRILRWAVTGVGLFAIFFSIVFEFRDYLQLVTMLIGALYLGGIGAVVLGGLYWKKGTTQGAWAALITGVTLALLGLALQQVWDMLHPWLLNLAGVSDFADYLAANPERCPLNGQILAFISMVAAGTMYIVVSLATGRGDFEMDRMLHRGQYAIEKLDTPDEPTTVHHRFSWKRLIGIDQHYTRGDKVIAGGIFFYTLFWKVVAAVILVWNLAFWRWPDLWWFNYTYVTGIYIPFAIGIFTTIWFTWGAIRDMIHLFRALRTVTRNDADDGMVRNHHNVGEPEPPHDTKQ